VSLDLVAKLCAAAGLGLMLWPVLERLRGSAPAEPASSWIQVNSPRWWAGLVLICLALVFQRLVAQQAAG
jgi:hypothetical protein